MKYIILTLIAFSLAACTTVRFYKCKNYVVNKDLINICKEVDENGQEK